MTPHAEYTNRLADRRAAVAQLTAAIDRVGQFRLIVFGVGVVAALAGWLGGLFPGWWALVGFGLIFVGLVIRSKVLSDRQARAARAVRYYEHGLDRLADRWAGRGPNGEEFADPAHLSASDLDLFGDGSLFQRLCTARTADGQRRLADWLTSPAAGSEVRERQRAVAELTGRLDLREFLALAGGPLHAAAEFAGLADWGRQPPRQIPAWRRWAILALGWFNVAAIVGWLGFGTTSLPLLAGLVLSTAAVMGLVRWSREVARPVEAVENELPLLEAVLARLEAEPAESPRLMGLHALLTASGPPSGHVRRLRQLADWYASRRNPLFIPVALLMLWDVRFALHFDRWRAAIGPAVGRWLAAVAELEALGSLAGYAFENPDDPFPELLEGNGPTFDAVALAHPLLAGAVRNDVRLGGDVRLLVVSGSNMSGKSTLLRAVGVNAVLALAGGPVRAERLTLTPVGLGATIRIQDSLRDGKSRFYAEVTRVRAVLDRAAKPPPVLFLFDELFAGTNSADRRVGAEGVLRSLLDRSAVGLVTTHDLALTEATARLPGAVNVHFTDRLDEGELSFDYRMRPGVVPHGNGVALMRAVGLEV
jgi:hypothetical protein